MNDKEWKIFNINKTIDNLYERSGFFDKYGVQVIIAVVIIILFVFSFTYISILNNLVPIRKNWETEKCNPLYMPFAGLINNDGSKSNMDYTIDNFNTCLGIITEDVAQVALDPLNYLIDIVTNTFSSMTGLFGNLAGYFSSIIASISVFIQEAYYTLLNSSISFVKVAEVIKDTFAKTLGVITTAMYSQILMMNISFLWLVYTPQKAAVWQTIISSLSILGEVLLLIPLYGIAWFFPPASVAIAGAQLAIFISVIILVLCIVWLVIITMFTNRVVSNVTAGNIPLTL